MLSATVWSLEHDLCISFCWRSSFPHVFLVNWKQNVCPTYDINQCWVLANRSGPWMRAREESQSERSRDLFVITVGHCPHVPSYDSASHDAWLEPDWFLNGENINSWTICVSCSLPWFRTQNVISRMLETVIRHPCDPNNFFFLNDQSSIVLEWLRINIECCDYQNRGMLGGWLLGTSRW